MDEALEKFKQEVQSAEMNVNDRAASTYHIVREMAQYLIAKEEQTIFKEDILTLKKAIGDVIKDKSPATKSAYAEQLARDCLAEIKDWLAVPNKETRDLAYEPIEDLIYKLQDGIKKSLIDKLTENIQYSTSPSCTKGMELFIKSIEDWSIDDIED